jgi:hypothetical protein
MAPRRVQIVLALEIETSSWPTNCTAGDTQAHPRDERCQSAMGSAADPRRVAQAWHPDRADEVAKYMARRRGPPSQGWKTFLRNHADGIAAMDMFVVPTISFRLLYGLLIMGHGRRQICGLASQRIRPQNGSQIRSRKHAVGNKFPAIRSVIGMEPMARSSYEDFG